MSGGPFRGTDAGTMVQALHQVAVQPDLPRPAVMQGLGWVMVSWVAYTHAAS